jgi:hypothetical protein
LRGVASLSELVQKKQRVVLGVLDEQNAERNGHWGLRAMEFDVEGQNQT